MTDKRHLSFFDQLTINADKALRTLASKTTVSERSSPAISINNEELSEQQAKHAAGLMRINHTGEVCAQALYQGQALTAKLPEVRDAMTHAAIEEEDHLAWCQDRINDLGSHTSLLNPVFYGLSFSLGAAAGLVSDKMSLGFVAAIEEQVCQHLEEHMESLPKEDKKSMAVIQQMHKDEAKHATVALEAGGYEFPTPIKSAMTLASKVMTQTAYKL